MRHLSNLKVLLLPHNKFCLTCCCEPSYAVNCASCITHCKIIVYMVKTFARTYKLVNIHQKTKSPLQTDIKTNKQEEVLSIKYNCSNSSCVFGHCNILTLTEISESIIHT